MTPEQYKNHSQPAIRRAFFRGQDAARAGIAISDNPYRKVLVHARARRGSWSEAFTRAWAVGHRTVELEGSSALAAPSGVAQEV